MMSGTTLAYAKRGFNIASLQKKSSPENEPAALRLTVVTIAPMGDFLMHRLFRASTVFFALLFCFLFGMIRPCAAQPDLSGYWEMRTPNAGGDGTFRETYFEIQQNGETLSGMLIRRPNGIPITGTFKGGAIHFATEPPALPPASSPAPPPQRPRAFDGSYEDGKLMLEPQGRNGLVKAA